MLKPLVSLGVIRRPFFVAGGVTYLLQENWTDAGSPGYDLSWTKTGTGTMNANTASPGSPMSGEVLDVNFAATSANMVSPVFTTQVDCWLYFMIYVVALPAATWELCSLRSAANECVRLRLDPTGRLEARAGSAATNVLTANNANGKLALNTVYHVWLHWDKDGGTAGAAFGSVGFSTSGTRPTSGDTYAQSVNGTITDDVDRVRITASNSATVQVYMDNIRVDDTIIGDNPT